MKLFFRKGKIVLKEGERETNAYSPQSQEATQKEQNKTIIIKTKIETATTKKGQGQNMIWAVIPYPKKPKLDEGKEGSSRQIKISSYLSFDPQKVPLLALEMASCCCV